MEIRAEETKLMTNSSTGIQRNKQLIIQSGKVQGKRRESRQKKRWEDNIKEWTGMDFPSSNRASEDRARWKEMVVKSSMVHQRPRKIMR